MRCGARFDVKVIHMVVDFGSIVASTKTPRHVNPVDLYYSLRVSDSDINDLWRGQGKALDEWHDNRNTTDVALVLNTGAGKTLIGLLIAQSLVNETMGAVFYVCSSIQLVEQ